MKIVYKDIQMEFYQYRIIDNEIEFIFRDNESKVHLYKRKKDEWFFGPKFYKPKDHKNKLFLWILHNDDLFQEGKELYEFLFKKSPLKLKLLMELGPDAYEIYK